MLFIKKNNNVKLYGMLKRLLLSLGFSFILSVGLFAQSATLKGTVVDRDTKEPIPLASVVLQVDGVQKGGAAADFDGVYTIKPIEPGVYTILVTAVGYQTQQMNNVRILAEQINWQDLTLKATTVSLEAFEIVEYEVPLISKDKTQTGGTMTSEEIEKLPEKSVAAVATSVGGVFSRDGEVGSIRGQRSSGTVYYIDGIKVTGSVSLPQSAYDQISVVLGGVPAQYGDVTGGVISMTTKGPSRDFGMGVEYQTSGFGEKAGLDPFGYNRLGINLNGPLIKSKNPADPTSILGYFIAGDFIYRMDGAPRRGGVWVAEDEYLKSLQENPIRLSDAGTGVWHNANFIKEENLVKRKQTPNTSGFSVALSGKLDVKTSPTANLIFGGNFNYSTGSDYEFYSSMMNYDENPWSSSRTIRAYGRYSQRFKTDEDALLQNIYVQLQADYTNYSSKWQSAKHKDNLFNYGYIGKYETIRTRQYSELPSYGVIIDGDTLILNDVRVFTGYADSIINFTGGDANPYLVNYMNQYYSIFNSPEGFYDNKNSIQAANGLLNGFGLESIYGLFAFPGSIRSGYGYSENHQIGVSFMINADIKDHAFQLGFQFEQKINSFFSLSPTPMWHYMRNFMNSHISELDLSNPILQYSEDGVFLGQVDYNFAYSEGSQFTVDKSIRQLLGLPIDGREWIDIDSYDPVNNTMNYYDNAGNYIVGTLSDDLSLDMFSPSELLDNELVSYRGFDAYGNKVNGIKSIEEFLTGTDERGDLSRLIGASRPMYIAGYIQDVFAFRDLIFNVGVRVDAYDANQAVLKDPYLLYPAYTVADIKGNPNLPESIISSSIPTNMGDDFVVYIDNVNDPKAIMGYRSGSTWYDATGTFTLDPETALNAGNGIAPYLVDPAKAGQLDASMFTDYKSQINVMPRISFSFPISDEALFFAHYDILTQRPMSYSTLSITDYYYLPTKTSQTISNPNLKPETTIEYEVGFTQALTASSALTISAFYRELRDQIQIYRFTGAYPKTYYSFENLDFGTIKGLTLSYDLRRTRNIRLKASYTLQFANGTGSDPEATRAIVSSGQPNLRTLTPLDQDQRHRVTLNIDYRYGHGKEYNGPKTYKTNKKGEEKVIRWLEGTGLNVSFAGGTGTPYTKSSKVFPLTAPSRVIDGSINGSRMPSFFKADLRLDRDIFLDPIKEGGRGSYINVFLQVLNVFNSANVLTVYSATGNPDDDGYLTSDLYQNIIQQQLSEESYRLLYSIRCNNPAHYAGPRLIRVGLSYNF